MRTIRFTQAARKHRIGRAHALHVIKTVEPERTPGSGAKHDRLSWVGDDDRGVELEIIAVDVPEYLLVIHVMPTQYRRRTR